MEQPTLTDLAEQMLWAAGSCDAEIVRMCLPYMTRKADDPWWNYVLMHATLPESSVHGRAVRFGRRGIGQADNIYRSGSTG